MSGLEIIIRLTISFGLFFLFFVLPYGSDKPCQCDHCKRRGKIMKKFKRRRKIETSEELSTLKQRAGIGLFTNHFSKIGDYVALTPTGKAHLL
jgi:hypothetical protein